MMMTSKQQTDPDYISSFHNFTHPLLCSVFSCKFYFLRLILQPTQCMYLNPHTHKLILQPTQCTYLSPHAYKRTYQSHLYPIYKVIFNHLQRGRNPDPLSFCDNELMPPVSVPSPLRSVVAMEIPLSPWFSPEIF